MEKDCTFIENSACRNYIFSKVPVMWNLEQDKRTLRLDKVNQVLKLFGYEVGAIPVNRKNLIHEES